MTYKIILKDRNKNQNIKLIGWLTVLHTALFNLPLDSAVKWLPNEDVNTLEPCLQSQQGILGLNHHSGSRSRLQPRKDEID